MERSLTETSPETLPLKIKALPPQLVLLQRVGMAGKGFWVGFGLFFFLLVHGGLIGLTDDEAYYWVLAQKLDWSYAFHPPAVAWVIRAFQEAFGWLLGRSSLLVRLPAALNAGLLVWLGTSWVKRFGGSERIAALGIASFFCFFALAWMMVPDHPLFLGWTLLFICTSGFCRFNGDSNPQVENSWWNFLGLMGSSFLLLMSKYSGILAIGSSLFCLGLWAPRPVRFRALAAVLLGSLGALVPILLWNAAHDWGSLLYQLRDRHSGAELSWMRFLRFWGIQLLLAGPVLFWAGGTVIFNGLKEGMSWVQFRTPGVPPNAFLGIWILPAALVYGTQPLFAEFKPHWMFIVWWPVLFGLVAGRREWTRALRAHVFYGLIGYSLIVSSCHYPWVTALAGRNLDVTNDFYGWSTLAQFLEAELPPEARGLPVLGSRYQTAAQLSFYLGDRWQVTKIPRDLKELGEWPALDGRIVSGQGPDWPRLSKPVLFVGDQRYSAAPEFPGAKCEKKWRHLVKRHVFDAKEISIWHCLP